MERMLGAEPDTDHKACEDQYGDPDERDHHQPCPECGGAMIVIEIFMRGQSPKSRARPWMHAA